MRARWVEIAVRGTQPPREANAFTAAAIGVMMAVVLPLCVLVWAAWVSRPSWASEEVRVVRVDTPTRIYGRKLKKSWSAIVQVELVNRPKRERATVEEGFTSERSRQVYLEALKANPRVRFWEGTPPTAAFHAGPSTTRVLAWVGLSYIPLLFAGAFVGFELKNSHERYRSRGEAAVGVAVAAAPHGIPFVLLTGLICSGLSELEVITSPFDGIGWSVRVLGACAAAMLLFAGVGFAIALYQYQQAGSGAGVFESEDSWLEFCERRVAWVLKVIFGSVALGCLVLTLWELTGTRVPGPMVTSGTAETSFSKWRLGIPLSDVSICTVNFVSRASGQAETTPVERWLFTTKAAEAYERAVRQTASIRVREWPWPSAVAVPAIPPARVWLIAFCVTSMLALRALSQAAEIDMDDDPMPAAKAWFWGASTFVIGLLPGSTSLVCSALGWHELHAGLWGWVPVVVGWVLLVALWGTCGVIFALVRKAVRNGWRS